MSATMDLISLYNYQPDLFNEFSLPESIEDKRENIIESILLETAELEILYSTPEFMKFAITSWSKKQTPIWDELYKTTQYDYNPIWNKDGSIKEVRKGSEGVKDNNTRTDNLKDLQTRNAKDKQTRDAEDLETRNLNDDSLHSVFGYNSNSDAPADKNELKATGTDKFEHTGTITDDHTGTVQDEHTGTQTNNRIIDRNTGEEIIRIEQGNIGLTSTQQLINEQREVVKFNIVDYITKEFKDRFCLKIY